MRTLPSGRFTGLAVHCARLSCVLVALAIAASARADGPCGRAGKPWVSLAFAGDAWTPATRSTVLADLRAELALQGFEACALGSRGSQPPLALIEITAAQADRVRVVIGVNDAITEKRIVRDVDLARVSEDGRGLAVAVAADELLRASWAELTLEDAPAPAMAPPPEVERTLQASLSPRFTTAQARAGFTAASARPRGGQRVGARFATEHHTGGQTWLGGDGLLALWFGERLGVELRVGAREGVAADADNGQVDSHVFVGAVGLDIALLPRGDGLELSANLGTSAASVQLVGRAQQGARAREGAAIGLGVHAGLTAGVLVADPLELRLDVGAGAPLRTVDAVDDGRVVSSTSGLSLQAGVGLGVRL